MKSKNSYGSVELICSKEDKKKRKKPYRIRIVTGWNFDFENLKATPIRKTIGYARTKAEGNGILEEYHNNLYSLNMNDVSLEYLFGEWYEYKKKKVIDHERYLSMFKYYDEIKKKAFNDITMTDLQRIVDEKINNLSGDYQKKIINLYHQLYNFAKANNMKVGADASLLVITKSKSAKSNLHKPFTNEEIEFLWNNRDEFVDTILIMIYTGCRPGELLKITEIHDDYFITGSKTEAGRDRIIPLHRRIKETFHNAYNSRYFSNFKSEDNYYQKFKKIVKKLNMEHTPYDGRHTFATLAKRFKMDDYSRKLIMGHHIADLTDRVYTHKLIDELIEEINKIDI